MKSPSVRKRLILAIGVVTAVAFIVGVWLVYFLVERAFMERVDVTLRSEFSYLRAEVEAAGDEVLHEWLDDVEEDPRRVEYDLVQGWDQVSGETFRSPALDGKNLPKVFAGLDEPVFENVVLPDGRRGRVMGVLVNPVVEVDDEDDEEDEELSLVPEDHPQVLVVGQETESVSLVLGELRWALALGALLAVVGSCLAILWIVNRGLRPLKDLSRQLAEMNTDEVGLRMDIPEDLPEELRGVTEKYGALLGRIDEVRARERDFSANAAHELRTPLAGIQSTLEQALNRPREGADYVERIEQALGISLETRQLIDRLMRFSRLKAGTEALRLEMVDLKDMVIECWGNYAKAAELRKVAIRWSFPEGEVEVETDRDLVRILLGNILENAVAYADEGSEVEAELERLDGGVLFRVGNICRGLPKGSVENFFEPFYREDSVRGADEGHSGLGLSLCREICRALGATIDAEVKSADVFEMKLTLPNRAGKAGQ